MSKRLFKSATAIAAAAVVVAGVGFVGLTPAQATIVPGSSLTLSPKVGGPDTIISATTSGPCAAPATRVRAIVTGPGIATLESLYSPSTLGFSTTNPITLGFAQTMRTISENNGNFAINGTYDYRIQCVNSTGATIYDEYQVLVPWVDGPVAGIDDATYDVRPATTTTVSTAVASPATAGSFGGTASTNISATVDAGAVDPTSGSVEFFDNAVSLGTAPVNASGVASLSSIAFSVGTHPLTAVFAASPNFKGSTASAVSFVVNNPAATSTTTTLAPITTPVEQGTSVSFDASVVPNNAAGKCEFYDGAVKLGETPVVTGTASFSTNGLGIGSHAIKAVFVPTNAAIFAGSESAVQNITVNPPAVGFNEELINIDVPAGALTISVDGDRSVTLPAILDTDGLRYRATGSMDDVRVVDTRAGSPGWTANGVLSPFKQGAADSISAANLGWVPSVTSTSNAGMTVTAGATVNPANGVAVGAGAGSGLSATRPLATSPAGSSTGTAVLDATLNLIAPTTTTPGIHTAVLTFTAI